MPRISKKSQLAALQDPRQPFLIDEKGLPVREDVLKHIREGKLRFTGARLLEDEQKTQALVEKLVLGWGVKRIATDMRISPHTVRAARAELVRQGKIAPYKERVVALFEEIVEVGAQKYLEALEDGKIKEREIPVGLGIIHDKRAQALGEPTLISAAASAPAQDQLSVEKLNAYLETLPSANPKPSQIGSGDSQSSGEPSKPQ
jgi:hypothetical protein